MSAATLRFLHTVDAVAFHAIEVIQEPFFRRQPIKPLLIVLEPRQMPVHALQRHVEFSIGTNRCRNIHFVAPNRA